MTGKPTRRQFLRMALGTSTMGLLAACGGTPPAAEEQQEPATTQEQAAEPTAAAVEPTATSAPAAAAEPTPAPTPEPIQVGEGDVALTMWVQDFGPAIGAFENAAKAYAEQEQNVKVTVQPVGYDDLLAKVLPSVAAGNEADVIMGYTDWYVATDVSRLFLPLDDIMGGKAAIESVVFPKAMETLDAPQGKTYYVPWMAGLRAAVTTVNVGHYKEAGIDYAALASWEDFVAAGQELTRVEGGKMTRAGLSPITAALSLVKTWIWQMGGDFYNLETGAWNFATPEGEAAAQILYDLYWGPKPVSSFDLFTDEYEGFLQGLISTQLNGAWTVGVMEAAQEGLDVDAVPTPKLANAKVDVVYPEHLGVITLSRRLTDDDAKLKHAAALLAEMLSADSLIGITESYSGSLISQKLYQDPRIERTPYGTVSKRIAEGTWPRARFPKDHVANQQPALQELERALRKEISIKDALANMDTYLNEQESQARERIQG